MKTFSFYTGVNKDVKTSDLPNFILPLPVSSASEKCHPCTISWMQIWWEDWTVYLACEMMDGTVTWSGTKVSIAEFKCVIIKMDFISNSIFKQNYKWMKMPPVHYVVCEFQSSTLNGLWRIALLFGPPDWPPCLLNKGLNERQTKWEAAPSYKFRFFGSLYILYFFCKHFYLSTNFPQKIGIS